jgi:hypothetical protein
MNLIRSGLSSLLSGPHNCFWRSRLPECHDTTLSLGASSPRHIHSYLIYLGRRQVVRGSKLWRHAPPHLHRHKSSCYATATATGRSLRKASPTKRPVNFSRKNDPERSNASGRARRTQPSNTRKERRNVVPSTCLILTCSHTSFAAGRPNVTGTGFSLSRATDAARPRARLKDLWRGFERR